MTTLAIRNVRAIRTADIDLGDRMTTIAGRNAAGKTSIALALQAILTGNPTPLTGAKKFDGAAMTGGFAKSAAARLAHGAWIASAKCTGTKCEDIATEGPQADALAASAYAVGACRFLGLGAAERAKEFWRLFKVEPSEAQLQAALEAADCGDFDVWSIVDRLGWDGAADEYVEFPLTHPPRIGLYNGRH
jgi:hypothetical protein